MALNMSVLTLCKFTPLGFETRCSFRSTPQAPGVNLPRWGLKQRRPPAPAWLRRCKFTPLGFETL